MASAKTKTDATQTASVPAVSPDTSTPSAAAATPASGRKLRWTSLPPAGGVAQRTKKSKAKSTTKTRSDKSTKEAAPSDKLSALDAAAKVLQEAGQPMNCQEMIQAMAAKGYWTSPGGQTPHATLYSAILREINRKGANARFKKTERGKFAHT